ncbi:MAG: hypothetical protein ABSH38_23330 [Verrucomicrobiota bacterium]|jgi:hypothetical protein
MKSNAQSTARLWVLLARDARVAAILRRGPSRQVQLIKWDLRDDTFEHGQWFKGRIYERRCDLSPAGALLIYFAATYKQPLQSWTAISKVPWFTAVAMWPKGDGWNGGGYFVGPYEIHLDHSQRESSPHPQFVKGCRKVRISSWATARGEDVPVWHFLLKRDGWSQTAIGTWGEYGEAKGYAWKAKTPEEWRKPHPKLPIHLEMRIEGIGRRGGPWYFINYRVVNDSSAIVEDLGIADWAEWDRDGSLLYARDGCLFRRRFLKHQSKPAIQLWDFNAARFEAIAPPATARKL